MPPAQTEELVRGIIESAPDAMIIVDSDGRIGMLNSMTERLFGYTREQLIGQPVECLLPTAMRTRHEMNRERFMSAPSARPMGAGRDLLGQRSDGSCVAVDISLNTLSFAGRTFIVAAVRDVTSRQQHELQLRELNTDLENKVHRRTAQLQAANQDLAAFSYSIAHDLRAPLRATIAFATRVSEDHADDLNTEGKRLLGVVTRSAADMSRMIDDYLRLSGLRQVGLSHERVDMRELAWEAWNTVIFGVDRPPILSIGELPWAWADRSLMRQVWTNILANAVKFSRATNEPLVRIHGNADHRIASYAVEDNGVGFDSAHAAKLFRVFERLHTQSEFEGNGIGLCIVQRVLHRHEGDVSITGAVDAGTRVDFWLPATPRSS